MRDATLWIRRRIQRFYLHKIAYFASVSHTAFRPEISKRSDLSIGSDFTLFNNRFQDIGTVAYGTVLDDRISADYTAVSDDRTAFQFCARPYLGIISDDDVLFYIYTFRIDYRYACSHMSFGDAASHDSRRFRKLYSVVDPHDFIRVVHRKSACTRAAFHGYADEIGDIIFILRILIAQFRQIFPEKGPVETVHAGIDFFYSLFRLVGVLLFYDFLLIAVFSGG